MKLCFALLARGPASRHQKFYFCSISSRGQRFANHDFDGGPVLAEEVRCVAVIMSSHSNAASLSAGAGRYLKVKTESDGFRILFDPLIVAAHLASPLLRRAL